MNSDHLQNRLGSGHGLLIFLIWRHFDLLKEVKFGVSRIFFRTLGRDSLTFYMLVYPDQIWDWLHFGHGPMVFLMLASCLLSETGHFFRIFLEHMGGMATNCACWFIVTTSRADYMLVTICCFSSFGRHFDLVKQVKFGVSGIFFGTYGRNGLLFDMLLCPDHIWNWLHFGHGLLVLVILEASWSKRWQ